ncbi:MAG: hypothetical protein NTV57_12260 [Cyanobacteria bacterium]|nr:hypothetical protein [Cyanobacteriota bacterium]
MKAPRRRPRVALALALGLPTLLVLIQQQALQRQPPHLQRLINAAASSGPAALQARFSRPMDRASLQSASALQPDLSHRWLGSSEALLLTLTAGQRLEQPLQLRLAGRDRRGLALQPRLWHWDPRPRVLAVVPVSGGEQLQLREHDGSWRSLSPIWPRIPVLEPLGDGSGVALASQDPLGAYHLFRIPLQQRNLVASPQHLGPVRAAAPQALDGRALMFAHLSSNRRGDLLVQSSSEGGGHEGNGSRARLWRSQGGSQALALSASGPMRLLPEGDAVVVPGPEGLSLQGLPPQPPRRQTLPGNRDLSAFCPRSGRALLLRHWPDYRRSLELVEPGQPPRQLWIGSEALVASACAGGGERIWALLIDGTGQPELTLLALDRRGQVLRRQRLSGWELEPGTGLSFDPSGDRLLAALRRLGPMERQPPPAQAVLIDARSLQLQPLQRPVRQVIWLPAG